MESDETLIYNAAHAMVSNLAGSLAHVTCKVSYLTLNLRSSVFHCSLPISVIWLVKDGFCYF